MESIKINNNEIVLPRYMNSLTQEEVNESLEKEVNFIVACGVHPEDGGLYLINSSLEIRRIIPNKNLKPRECYPVNFGKAVEIRFFNQNQTHYIDSDLILNSSENLMLKGNWSVNDTYMCSIDMIQFGNHG